MSYCLAPCLLPRPTLSSSVDLGPLAVARSAILNKTKNWGVIFVSSACVKFATVDLNGESTYVVVDDMLHLLGYAENSLRKGLMAVQQEVKEVKQELKEVKQDVVVLKSLISIVSNVLFWLVAFVFYIKKRLVGDIGYRSAPGQRRSDGSQSRRGHQAARPEEQSSRAAFHQRGQESLGLNYLGRARTRDKLFRSGLQEGRGRSSGKQYCTVFTVPGRAGKTHARTEEKIDTAPRRSLVKTPRGAGTHCSSTCTVPGFGCSSAERTLATAARTDKPPPAVGCVSRMHAATRDGPAHRES